MDQIPSAETAEEIPNLTIRSEADAYELLEAAVAGTVAPWGALKFDGWPRLEIYLKGEEFDSSLTPPVMKGLLEFQKGIYQSYAVARYEDPSKRLTDEEKKSLEIIVRVDRGSSDLSIDFQELAVEFVKQIGGKMDSTHLLIVFLAFIVMYFGSSALNGYLEGRKEVRLKEISDETQRKTLEALQFSSEQETARHKILADAMAQRPQVQDIAEIAYDSHTELVRGVGEADEARIAGVRFTGPAAMTLVQNARRASEEIRLDGIYRLHRLDWSDQSRVRVKVWNTQNGDELDAVLENDTLTGAYKEVLKQAEWDRTPVMLKINARRIGGKYRSATILDVQPIKLAPEAPAA